MTTWTSDELDRIESAEELEVAALRRDGTLRKPTTIWVVRDGDDVYVRSVYGPTSAWFRGVQARHEGRIRAGGVDKDVRFEEADHDRVDDRVDAAYRAKYGAMPSTSSMRPPAPRRAPRRCTSCHAPRAIALRALRRP